MKLADVLNGNISSCGNVRGALNALEKIRGYSAYEVAVINGFLGTEEEWLLSLKGKQGERGIQVHYDAETKTLYFTEGAENESGGYTKEEIDAMFGSYVNDIAEIVGGDA